MAGVAAVTEDAIDPETDVGAAPRGRTQSATRMAWGGSRVLVISNNSDVAQLLAVCLKFIGYDVRIAADGPEALGRARDRPDAVILDTDLPGTEGVAVLRRLRSAGIAAPVLLLSGRDGVEGKVAGLYAGADDYITKPFDVEELVARLRAVLRRTNAAVHEEVDSGSQLCLGPLVLDEITHEVWAAGESVPLSPKQFALLHYFMINVGTVLTKRQILGHVWSERPTANSNLVESCVSVLRRKVDFRNPRMLHTLRGVGYVLRAPSPRTPPDTCAPS